MSANDYISIKKNEKNKYVVIHRDADTDKVIEEIGKSNDLEAAVRKANIWQEVNSFVEYGLDISL